MTTLARQQRASLAPLMTSKTEHWLTPPEIFNWLATLGPVGLDPCAHPQSLVPAGVRLTLPERDGLASSWTALAKESPGYVWVNPPYGRELGAWASKIAGEAAAGLEIVTLVPARVDTGWWRKLNCSIWCAKKGRIKFWQPGNAEAAPGGTAPFPAAFCYHGPRPLVFGAAMEAHGSIYVRMGNR